MIRKKSQEKTVTEYMLENDDQDEAFFEYSKANEHKAYSVIYMIARMEVGNPKTMVNILRKIPPVWNAALSIVIARQNKDKDQSKRMIKIVKDAVKEVAEFAQKRGNFRNPLED